MTDEQVAAHLAQRPDDLVMVTGGDYVYSGWLVSFFPKRNHRAGWRCVIEDGNGRLFIHNPNQLSEATET